MADESKVEPSHIEATRPHEDEHNDWIHLQDEAREATDEEHQMGFRTAMARYPKAVFWSVVVSLVVIMDGYDTALIGSLFGFPAFQRRFGADIGTTGNYQVAAKWQEALGLASPLGNIVGIVSTLELDSTHGYRVTDCILSFLTAWSRNALDTRGPYSALSPGSPRASSSSSSPPTCKCCLSASCSAALLGASSPPWRPLTLPR